MDIVDPIGIFFQVTLSWLNYQLPLTGETVAHDTLTSGPTIKDNLGEPNIFFSVQTPEISGMLIRGCKMIPSKENLN